jgi:hypothetical protein
MDCKALFQLTNLRCEEVKAVFSTDLEVDEVKARFRVLLQTLRIVSISYMRDLETNAALANGLGMAMAALAADEMKKHPSLNIARFVAMVADDHYNLLIDFLSDSMHPKMVAIARYLGAQAAIVSSTLPVGHNLSFDSLLPWIKETTYSNGTFNVQGSFTIAEVGVMVNDNFTAARDGHFLTAVSAFARLDLVSLEERLVNLLVSIRNQYLKTQAYRESRIKTAVTDGYRGTHLHITGIPLGLAAEALMKDVGVVLQSIQAKAVNLQRDAAPERQLLFDCGSRYISVMIEVEEFLVKERCGERSGLSRARVPAEMGGDSRGKGATIGQKKSTLLYQLLTAQEAQLVLARSPSIVVRQLGTSTRLNKIRLNYLEEGVRQVPGVVILLIRVLMKPRRVNGKQAPDFDMTQFAVFIPEFFEADLKEKLLRTSTAEVGPFKMEIHSSLDAAHKTDFIRVTNAQKDVNIHVLARVHLAVLSNVNEAVDLAEIIEEVKKHTQMSVPQRLCFRAGEDIFMLLTGNPPAVLRSVLNPLPVGFQQYTVNESYTSLKCQECEWFHDENRDAPNFIYSGASVMRKQSEIERRQTPSPAMLHQWGVGSTITSQRSLLSHGVLSYRTVAAANQHQQSSNTTSDHTIRNLEAQLAAAATTTSSTQHSGSSPVAPSAASAAAQSDASPIILTDAMQFPAMPSTPAHSVASSTAPQNTVTPNPATENAARFIPVNSLAGEVRCAPPPGLMSPTFHPLVVPVAVHSSQSAPNIKVSSPNESHTTLSSEVMPPPPELSPADMAALLAELNRLRAEVQNRPNASSIDIAVGSPTITSISGSIPGTTSAGTTSKDSSLKTPSRASVSQLLEARNSRRPITSTPSPSGSERQPLTPNAHTLDPKRNKPDAAPSLVLPPAPSGSGTQEPPPMNV